LEDGDVIIRANQMSKLKTILTAEQNANIKLKNELKHIRIKSIQANDTFTELESYLPMVAKIFSEIRLKNEDLSTKANKLVYLEHILITEQNKNNKLRDELELLKNEKRQSDEALNQIAVYILAIQKIIPELKLKIVNFNVQLNQMDQFKNILIEEQRKNIELQNEVMCLKNKIRQVNGSLNQLEGCLPAIANTYSELILKNINLNAQTNLINQLKNVVLAEQRSNIKFKDEVTYLKKEICQVNDSLNHLEGYLPIIVNTYSELKFRNAYLNVQENLINQLKNDLITEQTNIVKLRNEVTYLKKEKDQINDLDQLENYLMMSGQTISELISENEDLIINKNQIIQLNELLKAEQKSNIKLKNDVSY